MTSYLMSAKEMPFTAADIRATLNLIDPRFDNLITAKIGSAVIMAESKFGVCLRHQVWAIQREPGKLDAFFAAARRIGKVAHVGPAYVLTQHSGVFHDVTFEPDYRRLAAVKAAIVNWCWDEFDIGRVILAERRGEYRLEWPVPVSRYAESIRTEDAPALQAAG